MNELWQDNLRYDWTKARQDEYGHLPEKVRGEVIREAENQAKVFLEDVGGFVLQGIPPKHTLAKIRSGKYPLWDCFVDALQFIQTAKTNSFSSYSSFVKFIHPSNTEIRMLREGDVRRRFFPSSYSVEDAELTFSDSRITDLWDSVFFQYSILWGQAFSGNISQPKTQMDIDSERFLREFEKFREQFPKMPVTEVYESLKKQFPVSKRAMQRYKKRGKELRAINEATRRTTDTT